MKYLELYENFSESSDPGEYEFNRVTKNPKLKSWFIDYLEVSSGDRELAKSEIEERGDFWNHTDEIGYELSDTIKGSIPNKEEVITKIAWEISLNNIEEKNIDPVKAAKDTNSFYGTSMEELINSIENRLSS